MYIKQIKQSNKKDKILYIMKHIPIETSLCNSHNVLLATIRKIACYIGIV